MSYGEPTDERLAQDLAKHRADAEREDAEADTYARTAATILALLEIALAELRAIEDEQAKQSSSSKADEGNGARGATT